MCLGIPGRIVRRWVQDDGAILAEADFAGELRTVRLNYLPDLQVGDFTIVHAGFALTKLDPDEAARTTALMRDVGLLGPEGDEPLVVPADWIDRPAP
ncbi:MAG: HypC/HybG/HupF family hydrogenase formation chaperone [Solirubrobacteraceae bacterium]|nr:HypC/HybG/HupF family hydrogenase formation chaperone [Solirubrobacteraceae bacterium]